MSSEKRKQTVNCHVKRYGRTFPPYLVPLDQLAAVPASFDLALDQAHPGQRVELVLLELQVDLFGLRHAEVVG